MADLKALVAQAKRQEMYFGFAEGKDKDSHVLILDPTRAVKDGDVKAEAKTRGVTVGKCYLGETTPEGSVVVFYVAQGKPPASLGKSIGEASKAQGGGSLMADARSLDDKPSAAKEDEADEADGEDDSPDQKKQIQNALKAKRQKPFYFQMCLKGQGGEIVVRRRKIPSGEMAQLVKRTKGKPARGLLYGEGTTLVFECFKTLPKKAGVKILLRNELGREAAFRLTLGALDLAEAGDEAPGGSQAEALYRARMENAADDLKEAREKGLNVTAIQAMARQTNALADQGKFDEANKLLDQWEDQLEDLLSGDTSDPDEAELYRRRLGELQPAYESAVKEQRGDFSKMRAVFTFAEEKAEAGQFTAAMKSLEALAKLLEEGSAGAPLEQQWRDARDALTPKIKQALKQDGTLTSLISQAVERAEKFAAAGRFEKAIELYAGLEKRLSGGEGGDLDGAGPRTAYTKTRLAWDTARKTVQSQLAALQSGIRQELPEEADLAEKLGLVLEAFDDRLLDALDDALSENDPVERKQYEARARLLIKEYLDELKQRAAVIKHIDSNPFVGADVGGVLGRTLLDMDKRLAALA